MEPFVASNRVNFFGYIVYRMAYYIFYDKDCSWVRTGIIAGWLPIGTATRNGEVVTKENEKSETGRINYYISPKKLYEETGCLWEGK